MSKKTVNHSKNFERIRGFYLRHLWSKEKVAACVPALITAEEYQEITGEPYAPAEEG